METQKLTSEVEAKIKQLSETVTQYEDNLNARILPALKELRRKKEMLLSDINVMKGAIQAYQICVQLGSLPEEPVVAEVL